MASPNKKDKGRTDITLMTLLANEATDGSRKLLKKYGELDAKNYKDLEVKLAELYFKTTDKVTLEKELAALHPHKKWILKNTEPEVKITETVIEEKKSNLDDNLCPTCATPPQVYSNVVGTEANKVGFEQYIGPVMLLAVIGLTFFVITKANK
jgi:hypothetical protein